MSLFKVGKITNDILDFSQKVNKPTIDLMEILGLNDLFDLLK